MSTIQIVNEDGTPKAQEQPKELTTPPTMTGPVFQELELKAVGEAMGMESEQERSRYQAKLETIRDYAKQMTGSNDIEGLRWAIRELQLKLGTPPLSEKRIDYVARYAYLLTQEHSIKREIERFEKLSK